MRKGFRKLLAVFGVAAVTGTMLCACSAEQTGEAPLPTYNSAGYYSIENIQYDGMKLTGDELSKMSVTDYYLLLESDGTGSFCNGFFESSLMWEDTYIVLDGQEEQNEFGFDEQGLLNLSMSDGTLCVFKYAGESMPAPVEEESDVLWRKSFEEFDVVVTSVVPVGEEENGEAAFRMFYTLHNTTESPLAKDCCEIRAEQGGMGINAVETETSGEAASGVSDTVQPGSSGEYSKVFSYKNDGREVWVYFTDGDYEGGFAFVPVFEVSE